MDKKEKKIVHLSEILDIPLDSMCDVPRTELIGHNIINIENCRGILDYDENSFKINTQSGIIKIDGSELVIESISEESVCLKGRIIRLEFL